MSWRYHFGRPFPTAYQLGLLLKDELPQTFERFGHPIGGRGSSVSFNFTCHLERQLS